MPKRAFVPPHPDTRPDGPTADSVDARADARAEADTEDPGKTAAAQATAAPPRQIARPGRPEEPPRQNPPAPRSAPRAAPSPTPPLSLEKHAQPPSADPRSADELTDLTIVKPRSDAPTSGWRRALYSLTGGAINPGIGPAERRRQDLVARIQRPLPGTHFVSVVSMKGGVGKSTVAALLGLMLSEHRGDRVVGIDANPDAGTLADRLTGESELSVRDLLEHLDDIRALPDVARYTSLIGRLQVVASAQRPTTRTEFDGRAYEQVTGVLSRYYDIIITDSGTGMLHSAMAATLQRASSLVVVGTPTVDGASRASKTLDWLVAHGYGEAVERAIVVLSADRSSDEVDISRLRAHFTARCRAVVEIPRDPHLAAGGRIEVKRLRPATADAYLELAALIADEFGSAPPQRAVS